MRRFEGLSEIPGDLLEEIIEGFSELLKFHDYRTTGLQDYRTTGLQHCMTTGLQDYMTS